MTQRNDIHPYYRMTVLQRQQAARERIRQSVDRIWRRWRELVGRQR